MGISIASVLAQNWAQVGGEGCSVFQTIDLPQHLAQGPLLQNHDKRAIAGRLQDYPQDNPPGTIHPPIIHYWHIGLFPE